MDVPWYHTAEVDAYAKRLFPLVRDAIGRGATLDAEFVREAVARYPVSRR
jgi:hypothetical protein